MNRTKFGVTLLLVLAFASALSAQAVNVTFKVTAPATTPGDAKLYITGDAPALKSWAADGVELKKNDDGTYSAQVSLPRDKAVEYKITRGSWETVEKNADGSEIANRNFTPTRDTTVEITVAAWADKGDKQSAPADAKPKGRSTRTGDIREHAKFHSKDLGNDRTLYVYLPPGYVTNESERYPVLYMHDGQIIFDAATNPFNNGEWRVDETAERLIKTGKIQPLIIVAISNDLNGRIAEYTFAPDPHYNNNTPGKGDAYMRFVLDEVKPFIDKTYRTKIGPDNTAVAGSSLGATMSIEMCRAHPDVFGKCAAMSPSLWWGNGDLPRRLASDNAWIKNCRIWLDCGSAESDKPEAAAQMVAMVNAFADILRQGGAVDDKTLKVEIARGAKHEPLAWAARMERVLTFLFPRP
jgi:predicted alpha/beta superfamily hydrolase